jgi:site-specific DNA recombinase
LADRNARRQAHAFLRLIGQARRFHEMVMNGHSAGPPSAGRKTISELAGEAGVSPSYFTRIFRLSFLAPEISKAILHGRQPITLTAKNLMLQGKLPLAWSKQRAQLGLA